MQEWRAEYGSGLLTPSLTGVDATHGGQEAHVSQELKTGGRSRRVQTSDDVKVCLQECVVPSRMAGAGTPPLSPLLAPLGETSPR